MAWIVGLFSDAELEALRSVGWVDEDPPGELVSEDELVGAFEEGMLRTRAFFVDNDGYRIMTGGGWPQPSLDMEVKVVEAERQRGL
jgi:hypothetical protein